MRLLFEMCSWWRALSEATLKWSDPQKRILSGGADVEDSRRCIRGGEALSLPEAIAEGERIIQGNKER